MGIKVGEVYPSNNCGDMEIIEYLGALNITVKFIDSGVVKKKAVADAIYKGTVSDKVRNTTPVEVGGVFPSTRGGMMEVVEVINSSKIKVRFFNTGYEVYAKATAIRSGMIKDVYAPLVCTVGYIGTGKYVSKLGGKGTKSYQTWHSMLQRCYDDRALARVPSYIGCTVIKEWHNYQVFAEWFNTYYIEGYELDKDIKVPGNKVYGPDTCMFVAQAENAENAKATTAVFRSPDGTRVEAYNIAKFARENGLDNSHLFMSGQCHCLPLLGGLLKA